MAIKISKVIAELNVGRQTIEEFLLEKGIEIDSNINARISDDVYEMLLKRFKYKSETNNSIQQAPSQNTASPLQSHYLIDTNVFIECPDIISRIPKEVPIVLSAKVADELDHLKVSLEEVQDKRAAQKALKNINKDTEHNIAYELSDVELLPIDLHKVNADNMILSIALKYQMNGKELIVLTSDNGMQVKAKALNVKTISLSDFLAKLS